MPALIWLSVRVGVIASGSPASLANVDLDRDLQKLSPAFDLARVTHAYDVLGQAQDALGRNASPKIVADWVAASI